MSGPTWYDAFFIPRPTARRTNCAVCDRSMWLPPSKVGKYKICSDECRAKARDKREIRTCETCGGEFRRAPGKGARRFCSQACNTASIAALNAPQVLGSRLAAIRKKREAGEWAILRGADHPNWRGGREVCLTRAKASGRVRQWQRAYWRKNRDKVREYVSRRRRKALPRLPSGTIARLREMQRNKCAICRRSVAVKSHLDHIIPLAKGGVHAPRNMQLLCPPCNLRKSARDPIEHMQSLGRLL